MQIYAAIAVGLGVLLAVASGGCTGPYRFTYSNETDHPVEFADLAFGDVTVPVGNVFPPYSAGAEPYFIRLPEKSTIEWETNGWKYSTDVRWGDVPDRGRHIWLFLGAPDTLRVARLKYERNIVGGPEERRWIEKHGLVHEATKHPVTE